MAQVLPSTTQFSPHLQPNFEASLISDISIDRKDFEETIDDQT